MRESHDPRPHPHGGTLTMKGNDMLEFLALLAAAIEARYARNPSYVDMVNTYTNGDTMVYITNDGFICIA